MNLNVLCNTKEQLYSALDNPRVCEIILEADGFDNSYSDLCHRKGKKSAVALPYVFREAADIATEGFDEIYIRSLDELELCKGRYIVSDYGMYCMNPAAAEVLRECGIKRITAPVELNRYELAELGIEEKELIVYAHIPMMISAQCIHKNTGKCDHKRKITWITDRTGKKLPVENKCSYCYNLIYNPEPLSLAGVFDRVHRLNPDTVRINLTLEDGEQSSVIINEFVKALDGRPADDPCTGFTRGHFMRGVE